MDGYYNALLSFIDKAVEEGFIKPTARHIIVLAPTPKELLNKLEVSLTTHLNPASILALYSMLEPARGLVWGIEVIERPIMVFRDLLYVRRSTLLGTRRSCPR